MIAIAEARTITQSMPRAQARTLRAILGLRTSPSRRRTLIVESGLPLGALEVASTFHQLCQHRRGCR